MNCKNSTKLFSTALAATLMVGVLAGCGSTATPAVPTDSTTSGVATGEVDFGKKANVSIASGASGGSYYMVGTALAQIIAKYDPNLICSSETTGGTNENIALVSSEETTIGMGMADDIVTAYNGDRDYEGAPADNLRAICAGQTNTFQIIVIASSDIHTLQDLKGKKISLGPAGAPYFAPSLLESACGFSKDEDYQGQYLSHDQAADALNDGDVDAAIATCAFPASAYANLAYTKDLRFISLTEEEMKTVLSANPTWIASAIPADTYNKQAEDVIVPAVPVWLFTYENVEEDVIYRICKTIFENNEELGTIAADAGHYSVETALESITIPVHPGAQKYLDEVAGR